MTPEQARWLVEQMTDEQRARLAADIRRMAALIRKAQPAVDAWIGYGIDAAERCANGGEETA